jgi:hypothetical protein
LSPIFSEGSASGAGENNDGRFGKVLSRKFFGAGFPLRNFSWISQLSFYQVNPKKNPFYLENVLLEKNNGVDFVCGVCVQTFYYANLVYLPFKS